MRTQRDKIVLVSKETVKLVHILQTNRIVSPAITKYYETVYLVQETEGCFVQDFPGLRF